jgi:hypothetical protein
MYNLVLRHTADHLPSKYIRNGAKYEGAAKMLENLICTTRESLLGSGAWNHDVRTRNRILLFWLSSCGAGIRDLSAVEAVLHGIWPRSCWRTMRRMWAGQYSDIASESKILDFLHVIWG